MDLRDAATAAWLDDDDAPARLLLDPRGRVSRRSWWLWGVGVPLAAGVLLHALLGIARVRPATADTTVNLLLAWPLLAMASKRLQDRDRHGSWALAMLVPVIGWLWLLVVAGFLRGTSGPNAYGPPPAR